MKLDFIPCPLCAHSSSFLDVKVPADDPDIAKYGELYVGRKTSEWKICGRCGFVHQNPRPTAEALNEIYLRSQYHAAIKEGSGEEHLEFALWYFNEKIEFALKQCGLSGGRVLDIGCGRGGVLRLFQERGWRPYGVEPDAKLANFAKTEMGLVDVRRGIFDSKFELDCEVDLVFSNHAFEHFSDLNEIMLGIQKILRPGGYLFIAIPTYYANRSSLSRRWMNCSHYSLFTNRSLSNLVSRYGFSEVTHSYRAWKKEIDDLWYLARYKGTVTPPERYYEEPKYVARYLRVINPLRSYLFYPVYSHWAERVRLFNAIKLLFTSPVKFIHKITKRLKKEFAHK
jgi:SAM-dependent methyltransferase